MSGDVTLENTHHEEYSSSDLEYVFGICGGGRLTINLVFGSACNTSYAECPLMFQGLGRWSQQTNLDLARTSENFRNQKKQNRSPRRVLAKYIQMDRLPALNYLLIL